MDKHGLSWQLFSAVSTEYSFVADFQCGYGGSLRIVREHSALSFSAPRTIFCLIYQVDRRY